MDTCCASYTYTPPHQFASGIIAYRAYDSQLPGMIPRVCISSACAHDAVRVKPFAAGGDMAAAAAARCVDLAVLPSRPGELRVTRGVTGGCMCPPCLLTAVLIASKQGVP